MSDVQWTEDSKDFLVISGKMPATVTMYDKNCLPYYELGKMHLNTIKFSPHNEYILLGGYASLAGEM